MYKIFAVMENLNNGIENFSFELIAAARHLALQMLNGEAQVCAVYFSNEKISDNLSNEIFNSGADIIYSIIDVKLAEFNSKLFASSLSKLVEKESPNILITTASKKGRELAPRVSTHFNTGLTADCTSLNIFEKNNEYKLASIRPTFGGRLMAEILTKATPQMATLREGSYRRLCGIYNSPKILKEFFPNLDDENSSIKIIELIKTACSQNSNLAEAQVVLSGGKGLKTRENFQKLENLVSFFNSPLVKLGASRAAIEAGIAPKSAQIGQTGVTICPKLYIAFGISGAIHHLIGVENAGEIIAVNTDKNAPIFSNCDYIINTCAINLLDELNSNF